MPSAAMRMGIETGFGQEKRAEAGTVLVAGAADGFVDGLDEVIKGSGGRAEYGFRRLRGGGLGAERGGGEKGGGEGGGNGEAMHEGILQNKYR